jgi:hypothetical protein
MKVKLSRQKLEKFHENLSSGSRVVSLRQMDGQTGMTKLIVAFINFVTAPKAATIVTLNALPEHSHKTGLFPTVVHTQQRFHEI